MSKFPYNTSFAVENFADDTPHEHGPYDIVLWYSTPRTQTHRESNHRSLTPLAPSA